MKSCIVWGMAEPREHYAAGVPRGSRAADGDASWGDSDGAGRVRALREHFGETQAQFAERLGTNQQTISEWERGLRRPRRMARRLLQLVAEQGAFYDATGAERGEPRVE